MPRFLNTHTGAFVQRDLCDENGEPVVYAILSHTWDQVRGEQTYDDLRGIQAEVAEKHEYPSVFDHPRISPKIREFCRVARQAGYELVWLDACCIDKSSSSELSEAIRSMFQWYRRADVCYVYLADVRDSDEDPCLSHSFFQKSRWHRRGWTLQELIAPKHVVFFNATWHVLGTKLGLGSTLETVTKIDFKILTGLAPLDSISVARRMWWASERETTRVEDRAYCLMGIFGVHLPVMYGEGRNAFLRLQEEIVRTIPDQSIFAWGIPQDLVLSSNFTCGVISDARRRSAVIDEESTAVQALLAPDPKYFADGEQCWAVPLSDVEFTQRLGLDSESSLPPLHCLFTPEGARIELLCLDTSRLPRSFEILVPAPRDSDSELSYTRKTVDVVGICDDPDCIRLGHTHLLALLRCEYRAARWLGHWGSIVALPLLARGSQTEILARAEYGSYVDDTPQRLHRTGFLDRRFLQVLRDRRTVAPMATLLGPKGLLIRAYGRPGPSKDPSNRSRYVRDSGWSKTRHPPWNVIYPANPPVVAVAPHCVEALRVSGVTASDPPAFRIMRSTAGPEDVRGLTWDDLCLTIDLRPNGRDRTEQWSINLQLTIPFRSPIDSPTPCVSCFTPSELTYVHYVDVHWKTPWQQTITDPARIPLPNGKPLTFSDDRRVGPFPCLWRGYKFSHELEDKTVVRMGLTQPLFMPLDPDWGQPEKLQYPGIHARLLSVSYDLVYQAFPEKEHELQQILLSFDLSHEFVYEDPIIIANVGSSSTSEDEPREGTPLSTSSDSARTQGSSWESERSSEVGVSFVQPETSGMYGQHRSQPDHLNSNTNGEQVRSHTHTELADGHSLVRGADTDERQAGASKRESGEETRDDAKMANVLRCLAERQEKVEALQREADTMRCQWKVERMRQELVEKETESEKPRRESSSTWQEPDPKQRDTRGLGRAAGSMKSQVSKIMSHFQRGARSGVWDTAADTAA